MTSGRSQRRNFGLKVGLVGTVKFEERINELVEDRPDLHEIMQPLLAARKLLRDEFTKLHKKVLDLVREDDVCRRLTTIPGVGPVVALTYTATIDIPGRFAHSKAVGSVLGLTPKLNESGESKRVGRVSCCGDAMMRSLLYETAQVLLVNVKKWSWLKAWAMNIARRRGRQKAVVALARRLAVIMHRMWSDGTEFCWTRESLPVAAQQSANVIRDGDGFFLQEFARGQQCPVLLARQCLHMHRPVEIDAHHLGYSTRIVAVRLIRLGFQKGLGMPGLDADHRQSCLGKSFIEPLRQWSGFKTDPLNLPLRVLDHRDQILRVRGNLRLPTNLACLINNADRGLFHRHIQCTIVFHPALLPDVEAVERHDLVLPSASSAAPQSTTVNAETQSRISHLIARGVSSILMLKRHCRVHGCLRGRH